MKPDDNASQGQIALLARIVECSHDAIFSVDKSLITTWNRGAERLYGYTAQEAVGQAFPALLWPAATAEEAAHLHDRLAEAGNVTDIETDHVRKEGERIAVRMTLSRLTDAAESPLGAVVTVRGIPKREKSQELWEELTRMKALVRQAVCQKEEKANPDPALEPLQAIDSRTGLTNRRTLEMNLDNECRRSARYAAPLSFLMLYVDNLRHWRETRGTPACEAILRQVGSLLQEEARTTDLVACYEKELLCIVLPHTDREGAMVAAERIRERVAAFYSAEQRVTVSVGVATFSHTMESGKALIAEAEMALSVAKQEGYNRAVHFETTRDYARLQNGKAAARTNAPTSTAPTSLDPNSLDTATNDPAANDAPSLDPTSLDATASELSCQAVVRGGDASLLNISRKDLANAYETTIEGWANVLDLRDRATDGHSRRVMEMTVCLARLMGVRGQELVYMRWGALLHDIGKIGIPDSILFKPGPLTAAEWEVMRSHPTRANEALGAIPFLHPALDIPFSHHEHWDGSGYPLGLKGEEIPLAARIFAIVDVWDALRSDRPYRSAWAEQEALDYIYAQSGKHFDPRVERAFHQMMLANHIETESEPGFLAV